MAIYALLIGINTYLNDTIRPLNGCKNDVKLMQKTLQERFSIKQDTIQILTNRKATKDNLVHGFQTHLAQAGEGDTALFYFSGHGSQEPASKEFWKIDNNRQLETLVCHDSRAGNVTDLADKELRYLIAQLSDNKAEVVVIIDSCHSGHVNRDIIEEHSATRQTTGQIEPRAIEHFIFHDTAVQQGWINDLAAIPRGKHILLSACRDSELSKEKRTDDQFNGIFTHALCSQLTRQSNTLSYHNLLMRVRALTHKQNSQQTPQIDAVLGADTQRPFLGTTILPIEMLTSFNKEQAQWELNAGSVHGIQVGDEVALHDSAGNDPEFLLLIAQVSAVFAGKSTLLRSVNKHKTLLNDLNGLDQINGVYSSSVSHRNVEKLTFLLTGEEAGISLAREAIKTLSTTHHTSDFIIERQGDEVAQGVDYRLQAKKGQYTISEANSNVFRPLFEPVIGTGGHYDKAAAIEALNQLEHLKRWHQKLNLENINTTKRNIRVDSVQLVIKHNKQEWIDSDVNLRYDYEKEHPKPRISLEIRCNPDIAQNDITLYCALLLFDAVDASVTSLLENEAKLLPPNICSIHFKEGHDFPVQVKPSLFNNGISETEDFLQLIVSDKPFDAKLLTQNGLELFKGETKNLNNHIIHRSPNNLFNLLEQELNFAHTRSFDLHEEPILSQWFTKVSKIITTRPPEAVEILPHATTALATGVRIKAHPSFSAYAKINTLEETTRSLASSQQHTHIIPSIFRDDALTPPFSFSLSRHVTTDLNILECYIDSTKDADSGGVNSISAEHPLVIQVDQPLQQNETILAYSYDGECYLSLGCSRTAKNSRAQTDIIIERLPTALIKTTEGEADKSLMGAIRIMFQKVLHDKFALFSDPTRLAIPLFNHHRHPCKVTAYEDNIDELKQTVEQADNILLILHGIIGDTRAIAGFSQRTLPNSTSIGHHYDCILTFDYESLKQPIQKTADLLKEKLAAIGLDKHHSKQLDLVAHSMGGLVSRCFIELNQGDKIVNKLVMLGTPNGGSQIAQTMSSTFQNVSDWANNTLTALINGYITNGLGTLAVSSLVKIMTMGGHTLGQMNPDSDFLTLLAKSKQHTVPYYIIAGNTGFLMAKTTDNIEAEFMQRMTAKLKLLSYKKLTEWLYKTPNDIAATVDSIQQLPENWKNDTQTNIVACNHLSYFKNEATLTLLEKILTKE
ncbi:MAG: caspase family protein [Cocleimonas sp.]|nr:caspase family protein [Cocleimonas sp.]